MSEPEELLEKEYHMQLSKGEYSERWLIPIYNHDNFNPILEGKSSFIMETYEFHNSHLKTIFKSDNKRIILYKNKVMLFLNRGWGDHISIAFTNGFLLWINSFRQYINKEVCKENVSDKYLLSQLENIPENHIVNLWEVNRYKSINDYLNENKPLKIQELKMDNLENGITMKIDDQVIFQNFDDYCCGFEKILEQSNCSHVLFVCECLEEGCCSLNVWTDFEGDNIRFKAMIYTPSEHYVYLKQFLVTRKNIEKLQERFENGEFHTQFENGTPK